MYKLLSLKKMAHNITFNIAQQADIEGILALQDKYLVTNMSEADKQRGFVTTPFSIAQLNTIIAQEGLFVAKDNQTIIGYIFAGSWHYFSQWPIFNHITALFDQIQFEGNTPTIHNSFQYGPICIDIKYRGTGLIKPFFEFMRSNMVKKYPISLTFINQINKPSFVAHTKKIQWQVITEFSFNNNQYFLLGYDMNKELV
ncbi:GNAT family acetyltransferase [Flavobacterium branchiophilum]